MVNTYTYLNFTPGTVSLLYVHMLVMLDMTSLSLPPVDFNTISLLFI